MDRLVYVAMSGAKETLRAQAANNHNLANASTTGFRADLLGVPERRPCRGPGFATRVYATDHSVGWNASSGELQQTGRDLDVAIKGRAGSPCRAAMGSEAYTRAGDLRVDANGQLVNRRPASRCSATADRWRCRRTASISVAATARCRSCRWARPRTPWPPSGASSSSIRRRRPLIAAPTACSAFATAAMPRRMPACSSPRARSRAATSTSPTP